MSLGVINVRVLDEQGGHLLARLLCKCPGSIVISDGRFRPPTLKMAYSFLAFTRDLLTAVFSKTSLNSSSLIMEDGQSLNQFS